jgi:hypothetical protein
MSFNGNKPASLSLAGALIYDGGTGPDTDTGDTHAVAFDKTATNAGIFDAAVAAILVALGIAQGSNSTGVTGANFITNNVSYKQALLDLDAALQGVNVLDPAYVAAASPVAFPAVGDTIETAISKLHALLNSFDEGIRMAGSWDATTAAFPTSGTSEIGGIRAGDLFVVSVAGTVDGVDFTADDRIVALVDVASSATYAANWFKRDYSPDLYDGALVRSDDNSGAAGTSAQMARGDHKHPVQEPSSDAAPFPNAIVKGTDDKHYSDGKVVSVVLDSTSAPDSETLPPMTGSGKIYSYTLNNVVWPILLIPATGENFVGLAANAHYFITHLGSYSVVEVHDVAAGVASVVTKSSSTFEVISQTAHGFLKTQPVYHNGTDWQASQGDASTTVAQAVVTSVHDANNFVITTHGAVTVPSHGLTAGQYYWLDQATSAVTATTPASGIMQGILHVRDADTLFVDVEQAIEATAASNVVTDNAASGYIDIGSMRLQWGSEVAGTGSGTQGIFYHVPFAAVPVVQVSPKGSSGNAETVSVYGTMTQTAFTVYRDSTDGTGSSWSPTDRIMWFATGLKP